MSNFNLQTELQNFIQTRELVEINLSDAPTFKVAYLLAANEDFLTFVEVSSSGTFSNVTICSMDDIEYIGSKTIYSSELNKQISIEAIFEQAGKNIVNISEFTFDGFARAFQNTKTIVELTSVNETTFAGRIIDLDDKFLVVDEYYSENDKRFSRSYFKKEIIKRLSVDAPWLRTISRALEDKNI